jgi:hypothetical protein
MYIGTTTSAGPPAHVQHNFCAQNRGSVHGKLGNTSRTSTSTQDEVVRKFVAGGGGLLRVALYLSQETSITILKTPSL